MSMQREHMWSAYLDGELSASEAAEFDQSLTPAEQERLQGEVRFEGAMGEFLSRGVTCPEDIWERTVAALPKPDRGAPWWMPTWQAGLFLAAATVMLVAAGPVYRQYFTTPDFLRMNDSSAGDARNVAQVHSEDVAEVNEFLHGHGVALSLVREPRVGAERHAAKLIGASEERYEDERVTEILYRCCGKPIKVVIAPKNSVAADAVRRAIKRNAVQDYRTIGEYVAVTVSTHPSRGLLDLLSESEVDTEIAARQI